MAFNELGHRFILTELHKDERIVKIILIAFTIIIVLLAINLLYLNIKVSNTNQAASTVNLRALSPLPHPPSLTPSPTQCPECLIPTPTTILSRTNSTQESQVKEHFITFGTGGSQATDWTDVAGLQASIDFGNYPSIKEVRFETSVTIPTANQTVSVRLFNDTDKHPVWFSEVITTNNNFVASPSIVYDKGPKTYKVQMKTQLGYTANLSLARVHIILQ